MQAFNGGAAVACRDTTRRTNDPPSATGNHLFDAFVETLSSTVGMRSRLLRRACVWCRRGDGQVGN
jgi:hypothetical protein